MSAPERLKPFPVFDSDEAAEKFVGEADLSQYDLSGFRPAHFEFESKPAQINMRLPRQLLDAVKDRAKDRGIPYTRFIREVLEREISKTRSVPSE